MLLVGGLRVAANSELRPPRLPNRRPPRWVLPTVGAAWILASYRAYYVRASHRLTTPLLAGLAVPGAAAIVFEAVRLRCAAKKTNSAATHRGCAGMRIEEQSALGPAGQKITASSLSV